MSRQLLLQAVACCLLGAACLSMTEAAAALQANVIQVKGTATAYTGNNTLAPVSPCQSHPGYVQLMSIALLRSALPGVKGMPCMHPTAILDSGIMLFTAAIASLTCLSQNAFDPEELVQCILLIQLECHQKVDVAPA